MTRPGDLSLSHPIHVAATPPAQPAMPPSKPVSVTSTPLSRFLDESFRDALRLFPDETPTEPGSAPLNARKLSVHVPVSCCYLTDSTGQNHCEHPPRVVTPVPWTWRRARHRALERWWDLREWLARALAGRRWPDEEE